MTFKIYFNWNRKDENEIFKKLGCTLEYYDEYNDWEKEINTLEELAEFQKAISKLQEDPYIDLIVDMDTKSIYFNNDKPKT